MLEAYRLAIQRGVARAPRAGLDGKRSPEGGAQATRRERRAWMPGANVRRRGTGDPEAACGPECPGALPVAVLWAVRSAGAAKVSSPRIALDQSHGPFVAVGAIGAPPAFADPGLFLSRGNEARH